MLILYHQFCYMSNTYKLYKAINKIYTSNHCLLSGNGRKIPHKLINVNFADIAQNTLLF